MKPLLAALALVVAACAAGPDAPQAAGGELACTARFCLSYPADWNVEVGEIHLSFSHPTAPETALATASFMNMEGVVVQNGGTWPASAEDASRALWSLLEEAGIAELALVDLEEDGSIRSFGAYEDGRLWHLLVPVSGSRALGVEVRGPNATWESHAEMFFSEVTIIPAP